jgi:hypothetical protein
MYVSGWRILDKVLTNVGQVLEGIHSTEGKVEDTSRSVTKTPADLVFVNPPKVNDDSDPGLQFSAAHFNVHNIKMRVFEKKSN